MAMTDEQYIQKMYDTQKQTTMNTLKSAYDSNVSSIDTAKKSTDASSYDAKREAVGNAAIARQRLNEAFVANGLNTGAVGQANLALLNQKAANLNDIEAKRVAAQAEYDRQKAQLTQEYQTEVKNAILENDAGRAEALYNLYKKQTATASSSRSSDSSNNSNSDFSDGAPASDNVTDIHAAKLELYEKLKNGEITPAVYIQAVYALPNHGVEK